MNLKIILLKNFPERSRLYVKYMDRHATVAFTDFDNRVVTLNDAINDADEMFSLHSDLVDALILSETNEKLAKIERATN